MAKPAVHRLISIRQLLRSLEHHLTHESKVLLKEFDKEYQHFSGSDLGADRVKKIRNYLAAWKSDLENSKYKAAGKDLEKAMDEIAALEKQLGGKH